MRFAAGEAEITAELNGITRNKAKITITDAEPTGYIISASGNTATDELPLNPGETQQLQVQALRSDGTCADVTNSVIWSSDNTDIASVSEEGVITAKQPGTANFTAKDAEGNIISQFQVTVAAADVTGVTISQQG